jgi:hypothetical protein
LGKLAPTSRGTDTIAGSLADVCRLTIRLLGLPQAVRFLMDQTELMPCRRLMHRFAELAEGFERLTQTSPSFI